MSARSRFAMCLLLVVLVGCQEAPPRPTAGRTAANGASASQQTLTIATQNSLKGFSPWLAGTTGGGGRTLYELFINGLVSTDADGGIQERLAAKLPSFDDGSIRILPDGRMQTIWTLRPGIRWHDGAPFTADDLVFSWQVNADPAIPSPGNVSAGMIEQVEAVDEETLLITWKTTFYKALALAYFELWPYPKHLLQETFERDRDEFLNLPFWTTQFVHLGPFRVVDFGLGENVVLQRFDDYYLGRPHVATIIIRAIGDPSSIFANVLANSVDVVSESSMPVELFIRLRDEWSTTGGGRVLQGAGAWTFVNVQYAPDWSRVPDVAQDIGARRGLLEAIDGESLRGATFPGFDDTSPDSFMPPSDPRAATVGKPFARYRYDPALALRDWGEVGWHKGPSGQMLSADGSPIEIPFRATASSERTMEIVAQGWREQGLQVTQEVVPGSLVSDRGYRAAFPGLEVSAQSSGDAILRRFDGRQCPRPPRYAGSQGGCYQNPELDGLIDTLYGTVDMQQQGVVLREIGDLLAKNVVMLPIYFGVRLAAVRANLVTPASAPGGQFQPALPVRDAYLWELAP